MQGDDLRHEAVMALIDLMGGFSLLETELLNAESIEEIINAINIYISELQEARKDLEGFREHAGSTPAAPVVPRRKPGPFYQ
jgi:hypothetical protein